MRASLRAYVIRFPSNASKKRLRHHRPHRPRRLQVEAAGDGIDVEHLACEEQGGVFFVLEGFGVDFRERHAAAGDKFLLERVASLDGEGMVREAGRQAAERFRAQRTPPLGGP